MYVICCYCLCVYKDLNRNENEINSCTTTTIIRIQYIQTYIHILNCYCFHYKMYGHTVS